ncbi:uncharacterized protein [Dysidea avara]|uniref:uncharacterized protein n=1 Tax=Dysidea avara TaxID=196820 RepID=UPI003330E201
MVSLEDMSMEELGEWVMEKFGWEAKDAFLDQGMDGEAVSLAFASTAGPDCLKDVVPKYGLRLKVYRAIKEQLEHDQKGPEESQDDSTIILSESDVNDTDNNNPVPVGKATPTSSRTTTKPTRKRSDSIASSSSLSSTERKSTPNKVPDPFPIPRFRKATEESFNQKRVADDDLKYVVRTLATVLYTYVQNPSMKDCEVVAKSLVSSELDYVIAEENCREKFIDNWQLYQPAIIAYSNAHKNKPATLKDALRDIDGDAGPKLYGHNILD